MTGPRPAALVSAAALCLGIPAGAADLSHRQAQVGVRAAAGTQVSLDMTRHAFRFGTAISSDDYLSNRGIGNGVRLGDTTNELFNSVTLINGFHWRFADIGNGVIPNDGARSDVDQLADFTRAAAAAQSAGLDVRGHAVLWPQNRQWLNPADVLPTDSTDFSGNPYFNAEGGRSAEHVRDRVNGRIDGILGVFAPGNAAGNPVLREFDGTNETFERYLTGDAAARDGISEALVAGGLYASRDHVLADWYQRMDAARPDARFVFNEYGAMTGDTDAEARRLRDRVQRLLDLGAPIDAIGVQMHMGRDVSLATLNRRIDILAETGLKVEVTEYDNFDGYGDDAVGESRERRMFEAALRAAFENPNVSGFTLWGYDAETHWRGDGLLFDADGNRTAASDPFFDLVRGAWMTDATLTAGDTEALTRGTYDASAVLGGERVIRELVITTRAGFVGADQEEGVFLLGDFNGDDTVDLTDAEGFAAALRDLEAFDAATGLSGLLRGDFVEDGVLDPKDVGVFLSLFDPGVAVVVPEPGLAALALAGAGLLRRRR